MNKLKKFMTTDVGWKLLSIVIATIMWIFVINVNQPIDTRTYYKKINVENLQALENQGLTIANIDDVLDTAISVKVKAQRTALDRLVNTPQNMTASIDLSAVQNVSAGETVSLPIDINFVMNTTTNSSTYSILSQSPQNLSVTIEELVEQERNIDIIIEGSVIGNKILSTPTLSQETVTLLGASSHIAEVSKVQGIINGGDIVFDEYMEIELFPVTADGEVVANVDINPSTVSVSYYEMATKTIPIYVDTVGTPSKTYELGKMNIYPSSISIIGEVDAVNSIDHIQLESIPVSNIKTGVSKRYVTKDYLPSGVYLSSGQSQSIDITIPLIGNEIRDLKIKSNQISVLGKDNNHVYLISEFAEITAEGKSVTLNSLDSSLITGDVDVTGLDVGEYILDIDFSYFYSLNMKGYLSIIIEEGILPDDSLDAESNDLENTDGSLPDTENDLTDEQNSLTEGENVEGDSTVEVLPTTPTSPIFPYDTNNNNNNNNSETDVDGNSNSVTDETTTETEEETGELEDVFVENSDTQEVPEELENENELVENQDKPATDETVSTENETVLDDNVQDNVQNDSQDGVIDNNVIENDVTEDKNVLEGTQEGSVGMDTLLPIVTDTVLTISFDTV